MRTTAVILILVALAASQPAEIIRQALSALAHCLGP